jgi:hypothetical protein
MASLSAVEPVLLPGEAYLRTVYRPDCEYVGGRVQERIQDYIDFGVEHIWMIDPERRSA